MDKCIQKLERRIFRLEIKLTHIKTEIENLNTKQLQRGLQKKQKHHLKKLYKVQNYYIEQIQDLHQQIVSIKCSIQNGYSSDTNKINKEN